MTATSRLLEFAREEHRLPAAARDAAVRLLGDTLAVGAAGRAWSEESGVVRAASGWGASEEARLLGSVQRVPAPTAAFVNGFRIHCLEWDAVHEGAVVHALSVVTAALGAAIDRRGGCEPETALAALAVGVDVASGLGIASTGAMHFFRPATAGVIGAALAVARIEGEERAGDVLGLAYSQAAGTMQAHVEGSVALPLQIAHAARAAVTAVDLVKAGLSGPQDALEGPFGFFSLFEEGQLAVYTDRIGDEWLIEQVSTKPFPCGRASHAVLGALATAETPIIAVDAEVPPLVHRLVGRPMHPDMTPAYARLCLPFLAALMIRDGRIDPRRFTIESFRDPEVQQVARRITISLNGEADPNLLSPQRVTLRHAGNEVSTVEVPHTLGSPAAPLSRDGSWVKLALARELAGDIPDPRIFDDPLSYFTDPR